MTSREGGSEASSLYLREPGTGSKQDSGKQFQTQKHKWEKSTALFADFILAGLPIGWVVPSEK